MIATTISQSKHLLELGLDHATADCVWAGTGLGKDWLRSIPPKGHEDEICPAWSLSALLDVMPKENPLTAYHIEIYSTKTGWNVGWFPPNDDEDVLIFYEKDLITAAYRMVVWLLENGHIKK